MERVILAGKSVERRRHHVANLVVHFEIHASEPQALIDFYSELLGWKFSGEVVQAPLKPQYLADEKSLNSLRVSLEFFDLYLR